MHHEGPHKFRCEEQSTPTENTVLQCIFIGYTASYKPNTLFFGFCEQLFLERLSEKVHATIPKGIVGGFVFTVFQRNLKEWHERPWTYVCEC